jgi:hypothetical protein
MPIFPLIRSETLKGEWDGAELNVSSVSISGCVDVYAHLSLCAIDYFLQSFLDYPHKMGLCIMFDKYSLVDLLHEMICSV